MTLSEVAAVMHRAKAVAVPPVPAPKNANQPDATPLGTSGSDLRATFVPPVKEKPPPAAAPPEGQATERPPALTPNDEAAEMTLVENPGPGEHMANAFTVTVPVSALTPKKADQPPGVPLVTSGLDCRATFDPPVSNPPPVATSLPLHDAVTPPAGLPTHTGPTLVHGMVRSASTACVDVGVPATDVGATQSDRKSVV